MPGMIDDDVYQAAWARRCDLLYKVWVQLRYHRKRQRFFDWCDKGTKSMTVLLGGTLIGQTLKDQMPYIAAAISLLGLLALVFGYTDRKQAHKELAEQAGVLIGGIEKVPAGELTPALAAAWGAEHARLCTKAPPPLKTLTLICEREQSIADGWPHHVARQPWHRRAFRHFA